jgi:hypothetical protein
MTSPIVQLDTNDGLGPVMRDETERYYVLLRVGEASPPQIAWGGMGCVFVLSFTRGMMRSG